MQTTGETGIPRRVLILTARMGGGHDAAAAELADRVRRRWPGSDVRLVDTLDVMGPGVGNTFRAIYVANVRWTPWLYQFFYDSLSRHAWFARASKATTSAWAGRRLAREIEEFGPDLILSTYPLAAGGLDWLRRRRSLAVETYAWVTDYAPHTFWLYRRLDRTFVMHQAAIAVAEATEPGISVAVAAAPVSPDYHPGDPAPGRYRLGLEPEDRVVLVSGGAYGFGSIAEAVKAALAAGPQIRVVVACGRNDHLRRRLAEQFAGRDSYRLRLLGWRDDMPEVTRAADVVVTNAGGMTALEALECRLPIVLYRPIAAHGLGNASLMVDAGVATVCFAPGDLTRLVGELTSGADRQLPAVPHCDAEPWDDPTLSPRVARARPDAIDPRRSWPLRAQDAFFLYVQNASVSQQVGAVITARAEPGAAALTAAVIRQRIGAALPQLPELRRRPVARGRLRRPGWITDADVDLDCHIIEKAAADAEDEQRLLDGFWSEPVALDIPPWQALLITRDGADSLLCFKFHHALGDGMSLIGALDRILDRPDERWRLRPVHHRPSDGLPARIRRLGRTARGIWELGVHAAAPKTDINRPLTAGRRGVLTLAVPSADLRAISGRYRCRGSELMMTILAEAMSRSGFGGRTRNSSRRPVDLSTGGGSRPLDAAPSESVRLTNGRGSKPAGKLGAPSGPVANGSKPLDKLRAPSESVSLSNGRGPKPAEKAGPARVRTMLPVAMGLESGRRTGGNRTGVVSLDLPVGPMDFGGRLAAIRHDLDRRTGIGEPEGGDFVMRAIGAFPAPVHAWMSRRVYNAAFFNLLTSYIPGSPRPRRLAGHTLTEVYPVLGLAEDVPLAIGVMRYAGTTGICLFFDEGVRQQATELRNAIERVIAEQTGGSVKEAAATLK